MPWLESKRHTAADQEVISRIVQAKACPDIKLHVRIEFVGETGCSDSNAVSSLDQPNCVDRKHSTQHNGRAYR